MTKTIQTINSNEELLLLDAIKDSPTLPSRPVIRYRNYTMALLMLDAGLRVGEVVTLRVDQLWYAGNPAETIAIEPDQNHSRKARDVPVSRRLHVALQIYFDVWYPWLKTQPRGFAFCLGSPERHLATRQVHRIIRKAGMYALRRPIHPHMLRHTFATKLMRKCPTRVVQDLLGHTCLSSTQIYTHPNDQDFKKAIEALDEKPNVTT